MLNELVDLIEALRARINEHRSVLQGNEAQTRMSLIDPLLRALGWDTTDPGLVRPDHFVSGRLADYALLDAQGDVIVFLEARRLGENLAERRSQVVGYASELGIRFPALSNGSEWEIYDNSQPVPIDERRVLDVSIADADSAKCALQLLLLWHPNMASGQPIGASEPILGTMPGAAASDSSDCPDEAVPPVPGAGWTTLREFDAKEGELCPPEVLFPDGREIPIRNWRGLIIEVTEWLIDNGDLTPDKSPVTARRRQGYCTLNVEPKHPNGDNFFSYHRLSNGLYLDVNFSAQDTAAHSVSIVEHCGRDPSTIHVKLN